MTMLNREPVSNCIMQIRFSWISNYHEREAEKKKGNRLQTEKPTHIRTNQLVSRLPVNWSASHAVMKNNVNRPIQQIQANHAITKSFQESRGRHWPHGPGCCTLYNVQPGSVVAVSERNALAISKIILRNSELYEAVWSIPFSPHDKGKTRRAIYDAYGHTAIPPMDAAMRAYIAQSWANPD